MVYSLLGLVLLVLAIFAIVKCLQSSASTGEKALWIVLILVLPVIGVILFFLIGPKGG